MTLSDTAIEEKGGSAMSDTPMSIASTTETTAVRAGNGLRLTAAVLALVGAALVAAAVWLPWATGAQTVSVGGQQQTQTLQISAGDVDGVFSLAAWSLVMVLGMPLAVLLWVRGPRTLRVIARGCYLLWAFASLGVLMPTLIALLTANPIQLRPELGALQLTVPHQIRPAMVIAYLGILLALLASALAFLELRRAPDSEASADQQRPPRKLPASGALTLSAVLFLVGIFVMPWATVNCTQTPLFIGQCTGVSFAGATSAGIRAHLTVFDPLAAQYAAPILLAAGALLLLLGVWRRDLFRAGGLWLVLWLIVATSFAVVGDLGVGALVTNPVIYGLPAGKWSGDTGIIVAFLGLLLGWGGTLYLSINALRE